MEIIKYFSKSQAGQEYWAAKESGFKNDGFFIDIGAHNGMFLSNTSVLERNLGWKGICIEADPERFRGLEKTRLSTNVCVATRDYEGYCSFNPDAVDGFVEADSNTGETKCDTLDNILEKHNAPETIDYISLDIEGLEYEVLSSFNFLKWDVKLWTIEHNMYLDGPEKKEKIYNLMIENRYERAKEDVLAPTQKGMVPFEDWYKKIN